MSNIEVKFGGNSKPLVSELKTAGAAVKQFGEQSEKYLQKGEISAKQMAFALRGVPMQFTDIVTSLQAGQNPLTVFLQQGGQLKDMFGGAGIAARAMGGYIMGLVSPLTVAAAAGATLGAAYYQGAKESSAYTKAITMSGNAMGTTAGQLKDMAQNVANSTGATVGAAAAGLVQLVNAGGIATDKLERITGIALAMEKQAGVAVADTVKQFVELGKDPVKASENLNETTNFLTASIYNQIKALQDQGDAAGAATLAQTAAMDQMRVQNTELVQDLGYLETAFDYVWGAIKKAGDELKDFGRTESIAARIAELQAKVAYGPGMYGTSDFGAKARAQEELTYLLHIQASQRDYAAHQKLQAEQTRAQIKLEAEHDKGLSKRQQMQKALTLEAANFAKVDQSIPGNVEKYHANMAAIQARYTETVKVARVARVGLTDAEKEAIAMQKALEKSYADGLKEIDASRDSQQKLMAASFEEVDKAQAAYDAHGKLTSVIMEETLARLENARVITAMAGEDTAVIDAQIANRKRLIEILRNGEVRDASEKAASDMQREQKRAAEESAKYWEDALMRAFESGKGFFQSLWDTIKNTLKTQVLRVMVSATGLTGMSAAGAGDLLGGGGGGGNLLSTAANLGKIYDTITTGFSALGDSVAFAAQDMGAWLVNNTSGVLNQAGASLMQSAGTFGTVAGYAAGAAAGLAIGNAISGKYGSSGVVTAGTAIGSILGGPIGGAIGGAIGGLVNRAFGRGPTTLTSSGTRGTFSGNEFSGVNYANYKKDGGWFRSDKSWTDITAMNSATRDAWSTAFAGVKGSVASMAASLGLATDSILSYSKYIDVAAGTTEAQLTAIFTGMADDMATAAAPGLAAFAQTGESASTTLSRLGSSLNLANQWLSQFNDTLLATSLAGGDQASRLLDTFGGSDQYATAQSAYYQVMYTDAQRMADTTVNVTKALALVNVAMPSTLDAYNALRNGLDLTTEAGRNAYTVMTLLGPEFAQVAEAAQSAATESVKLMNDVFDTLQNRLTGLIDSIASERAAVAGASAGMLGLQPKTAAQLAAEIAASKVALPSDAGVLSALAAKSAAQTGVDAAKTTLQNAQNSQSATGSAYGGALTAAQTGLSNTIGYYKNLAAQFQNLAISFNGYQISANATSAPLNDAFSYNAGTNQLNGWGSTTDATQTGRSYTHFLQDVQRFTNAVSSNGWLAALQGGNTALASAATAVTNAQTAYNNAMTAAAAVTTTASTAVTAANAKLAAADAAAKTALLAYAAAMTQYSGDAEKAVKVLSQLREETVAYYEAQKELAGLMTTSAANLRAAVRSSQFGQLSSSAALAQQQRDFAGNYSLALATSGATKAGYADNLTAALPALTSALMDTSSTRSAWALATAKLYSQSETIAAQLDSAASGMNFEAESLSLLGSIDVALGELDTNTAILKNAIDGGTATSAAGLRAIVTQLGGVPAFASGGYHAGGVRIVGENGPELEVTGPSRIFNAGQLRGMGGDNAELVAEMRALRREVEGLRLEARATASNTNKTAKILGRVTQDGESITTTVLA